jgi:hypothetical protein
MPASRCKRNDEHLPHDQERVPGIPERAPRTQTAKERNGQMTKEEAIRKIHAEAACKTPRSPQFMADFAEVVIRQIDGVPEGGQKDGH